MFAKITEKLSLTIRHAMGKKELTEKNIQQSLLEVQNALLEADCSTEVVDTFIKEVRSSVLGTQTIKGLTPAETFIDCIYQQLIALLGGAVPQKSWLSHLPYKPAIVLMAGLQGSGKTTTLTKLAYWVRKNTTYTVGTVSCDIYRPAAIQQLSILSEQIGVPVFSPPNHLSLEVSEIARQAQVWAKNEGIDLLFVDTAGRLHIDKEMMEELKKLHALLKPLETLFVLDAMTGQDAAKSAQAFKEAVPLTGIIPTKLDGDARGGALLSAYFLTDKVPIRWIGSGEKVEDLEPFEAERIAGRILGMGDIRSFIDQAKAFDQEKLKKLHSKLESGKSLNLEDLRVQLLQIQKMGGIGKMLANLPGFSNFANRLDSKNDKMDQALVIIQSMTLQERHHPNIILGTRKRRIAKGAGVSIPAVEKFLKQYQELSKMTQQFSSSGMLQKFTQAFQNMSPFSKK